MWIKLDIDGMAFHLQISNYRLSKKEIFELVNQMKTNEGITEQLKADNQMEWVRRMNNIRHRATEIINYELIYA